MKDPRYSFEIIETLEIQENIKIGGKEYELSDHAGYQSTIQIKPQKE